MMPHYGTCPYWIGESRDLLETRCEAGVIKFKDLNMRRLVVFPLCSGNWRECGIYKALYEAGIEECEDETG